MCLAIRKIARGIAGKSVIRALDHIRLRNLTAIELRVVSRARDRRGRLSRDTVKSRVALSRRALVAVAE
jgi:hypothetical protein